MAKGIVRKTEKAAKKQLRQEGAFKGLSRKERITLSKKTASESRDWIRSQMAEGKKAQAVKKSASDAKKREEARASGNAPSYDRFVNDSKPSPKEQREKAPGGVPTKRLKGNENVSFDDKKGMYKIAGADGYTRYSKSKPAMYGAKVKAVKKAQEGGKVKSKSVGVLKSDTNKAKSLTLKMVSITLGTERTLFGEVMLRVMKGLERNLELLRKLRMVLKFLRLKDYNKKIKILKLKLQQHTKKEKIKKEIEYRIKG